MPECITLSIGGISILLSPDQASGQFQIPEFFPQFTATTAPQIELKVHCGWFPPGNGQLIFETVQGWKIYETSSARIITLGHQILDPYVVGIFTPDFRSGEIHVTRADPSTDSFVFPLTYPMGELFMMNLLGTGLGLLCHASGVIYNGKAYLFTGHGGIGKTTTARLWARRPGAHVVNDDKVIVRKEGGRFWMYGTPWPGEGKMALPEKAPLEGVFMLKQADRNAVTDLSPAETVGRLLARAFLPLWDRDKVNNSLQFLQALTQAVPCREFGFVPDMSAVDFVLGL